LAFFRSNAAWVQDFQLKSADNAGTSCEFEDDLVRYMYATGWPGCAHDFGGGKGLENINAAVGGCTS
jgi:hypothetical protein